MNKATSLFYQAYNTLGATPLAALLQYLAAESGGGGGGSGTFQQDISAGGTITLDASVVEAAVIDLTGAAASPVFVVFPAEPGVSWDVRNLSTDNSKYVLLDNGGLGILLPPGASRRIAVGTDGVPFAADGKGLGFEFQLGITGGAVGSHIATLFALPAGYIISDAYSLLKAAPAGASSVVERIGVQGGSTTSVFVGNAPGVAFPGTVSVVGGARGISSTDQGTAWSSGLILTTATTVFVHEHIVSVATAAAMRLVETFSGKALTA